MKPVTVVSFEEAHISDVTKSQHIKLLTGATLMTFRDACFFIFFGENALNLVMTVLHYYAGSWNYRRVFR